MTGEVCSQYSGLCLPPPPPTPLWQEIIGYTCFGLLMGVVLVGVLAVIAAVRYRR